MLLRIENGDLADAMRRSIVASNMAMNRWRRDFIDLWLAHGDVLESGGKTYLGNRYIVGDGAQEHQEQMLDLIGLSEEGKAQVYSTFHASGVETVRLNLGLQFAPSEARLEWYLNALDDYVDANAIGETTYVFRTTEVWANGLSDVNADVHRKTEILSFDVFGDAAMYTYDRNVLFARAFDLGRALCMLYLCGADYTGNVTVSMQSTATGEYDEATWDEYYEHTFTFTFTSLDFLRYQSAALAAAIDLGGSLADYEAYQVQIGKGADYVYLKAAGSVWHEDISLWMNVYAQSMEEIGGYWRIDVDAMRRMPLADSIALVSRSIGFEIVEESSWLNGTFLGNFIGTILGGIGAVFSAVESIPIINPLYWGLYGALKLVGVGDLDAMETAYLKLRTAVGAFYASQALQMVSEIGMEATAALAEEGLLLDAIGNFAAFEIAQMSSAEVVMEVAQTAQGIAGAIRDRPVEPLPSDEPPEATEPMLFIDASAELDYVDEFIEYSLQI